MPSRAPLPWEPSHIHLIAELRERRCWWRTIAWHVGETMGRPVGWRTVAAYWRRWWMAQLGAGMLALLPSLAHAHAAPDCRPLPEILVEAELERGEVLRLATDRYDGTVIALLVDPADRSESFLIVTEGPDVDQACIVRRTIWIEP